MSKTCECNVMSMKNTTIEESVHACVANSNETTNTRCTHKEIECAHNIFLQLTVFLFLSIHVETINSRSFLKQHFFQLQSAISLSLSFLLPFLSLLTVKWMYEKFSQFHYFILNFINYFT